MIKTVSAPDDSLYSHDLSAYSRTKSKKRSLDEPKEASEKAVPVSKRKEMNTILQEVKELNASTFSGMAKKKHKEDVLTKLGVYAPKPQKMPFKMALGIKHGREKRAKKNVTDARESGVVLSLSAKKAANGKSRQERYDRNDSRSTSSSSSHKKRNKDDIGLDTIKTKSGIFHLSKDRLPKSLGGNNNKSRKKSRR